MALLRSGHDEAFQIIYDRYHKRLTGYVRQMLPRDHDPEDVLQDVFVRAYRALLHDDRELAVRPWLFRVAHNCCIDELRRNVPVPTDELSTQPCPLNDPAARVDARDTLRRLIEDIGRLPEQQRAALLLRELSGISYGEVAAILDTTVPAVKSLLVRARTGLVRAGEARDTACSDIRAQIALAHDQGVRATPTVRRHLRDCATCRSYRGQMRVVDRRMAALLPAGPLATLARLVGLPGGSATGSTAALGASGTASGGAALGANHVAALVAAAIASAGGAVGLQHVIASSGRSAPAVHRSHRPRSHGEPATVALGSSYDSQASEATATSSVPDQGSASGTGSTAPNGGAGNPPGAAGSATSGASTRAANSPTPTAPPGWLSTGPAPTPRPTTADTGPTPTSTSGDGSSGSPAPTSDGTGSTSPTGDSSGASSSTSTGSTGTTDGTSTTGTTASSTSDPGATTATVGDGSTVAGQSSAGSTSSSGTGS